MTIERSVTEKIEFRLAQIRKWNPEVNAIVSMRQENDILDEAFNKEKLPIEEQGELHGEIIAIKDLANAKGFRTTQGSPIFANEIADNDDIIVARMRQAGAIIIGKTNSSNTLTLKFDGKIQGEIPIDALANKAPEYDLSLIHISEPTRPERI